MNHQAAPLSWGRTTGFTSWPAEGRCKTTLSARAWAVYRNGRARPEEKLSAALRRAARLLLARGAVPDARLWKTRLEQMHVQLGFAYDPRPVVPVKLHLFRELALLHHVDHLGYIRYDKADFGWRPWAGVAPTVLWVDGHHDHIMASEKG